MTASPGRRLDRAFFARPPLVVARELIGATLTVDGVGGVIVETEAYDRGDEASHSHAGPTARNAAMFGPAGCAYVYLSYGLHWCLNLVCGPPAAGGGGAGAAVLVRAIAPTLGIEAMCARRGLQDVRRLCAGPGRLGQALGVTRALDALPLDAPPFALWAATAAAGVVEGPRIGVSKAAERPWRFGQAGSPFLSRRFPAPEP